MEEIINILCDEGFSTFIVGGAVRDMLLGQNPEDIDIATKATPNDIQKLFSNVKLVGESFGVALVNGVEVTTFRADRHFGIGDENCVVDFADTIEDDLSRRDFTINAMALCHFSGEIIDPYNGKQDLQNSLIKFVGNPEQRILEDPNRIIRACRFLAKIDGEFESYTLSALQEFSFMIESAVAPERVRKEIIKAMALPNASAFFSALKLIGALRYIFPSLDKTWNLDHGNYHKETIYDHNMLVGDSISPKFPLVKLSGYLHDVGKPVAAIKNNYNNFARHEVDSEELARKELTFMKFSNYEVGYICGLIRSHMYSFNDLKPKTARKILSKINDRGVSLKYLFRLKIADRKGNLMKNPFTFSEIRGKIEQFQVEEETPFTVKSLAVTGGDLINHFNLTPSPLVGEIQRYLLEYVIEEGGNERETLLKKAEEYLCQVD